MKNSIIQGVVPPNREFYYFQTKIKLNISYIRIEIANRPLTFLSDYIIDMYSDKKGIWKYLIAFNSKYEGLPFTLHFNQTTHTANRWTPHYQTSNTIVWKMNLKNILDKLKTLRTKLKGGNK